jgi:hypothetical protein
MTMAELTRHELIRLGRRRRDASTRFKRCVEILRWMKVRADVKQHRWLIGYEAEQLLADVLSYADELVYLLNTEDSSGYDIERDARELAARLRNRRLALHLENVTGRTAEEAAAFRLKAAELRDGKD